MRKIGATDNTEKAAGIENFKYHDLRHTCASHLAMNGAIQGELMEILEHRSPTIISYTHFSKEHISRILQRRVTVLWEFKEMPHDNLFTGRHRRLSSSFR